MDLHIGGYLYPIEINKTTISPTKSYLQDDLTWCVSMAKPKRKWDNLFRLHDTDMWAVLVLLVPIIGAAFFYIFRFDNVFKSYAWNVHLYLLVAMGGSVSYQPKNILSRILYMLIAIFGLEYNILLNCFTISTLTKPLERLQVDNINAAIYNNYDLMVPSNYLMPMELLKSIINTYNICF